MRILICAAEQEELDCAIQALRIYESNIAPKVQVDFMLTGIGTTSTCYRLTKKIVEADAAGSKYTLAINIGIAGSYDLDMFPIGSAAIVVKEHFGDLGFMTQSGFRTLFDSKTLDANLFPFTDGALNMPKLPPFFADIAATFKSAVGVTVQTVTGTEETAASLIKKYSPQIESMEGAAFYYVCLNEYLNCFELRSVSNKVGDYNPDNWETPAALEALKEACKELFRQIAENQHK